MNPVFLYLGIFLLPLHFLLVPIISDEKIAVNLIELPLYVVGHFSFGACKILSLSLFLSILTMICLDVDLFAIILVGVH